MIKRDKYLAQLISNKENGFPKVITGIRRCGKSFLLKEIYRRYLIDSGTDPDNILTVELDMDTGVRYRNPLTLGKYVRDYCRGKGKCFVFIDEIQLVNSIINPEYTNGRIVLAKPGDENAISFVEVVLGLSHEKNIDLYVTGSNSRMLSSDIVTEFRDKATIINIGPLSFEEYYLHVGGSKTEAFSDYLRYGGMPLAVLKEKNDRKTYLKNLFNTTYIADILEHNRIKKSEALDELCNIISACTGELINSQKLADTYNSVSRLNIDKDTVTRYIGYFIDAFIIREARRYDVKGKREIGAQRKYYFADTGLRNARLDFSFTDEGHLLETAVFNELVYNGYSVSVGTYDKVEKDSLGKSIKRNYEIDFLARRGNRVFYIQTSSNISKEDTRNRELKPFIALNDQIQKVLVVNKPIDEALDENGFIIIGITDFLLRFIK